MPASDRADAAHRSSADHPSADSARAADLVECVLDVVAEIPPGRVSTYGRVAVEARVRCGRGSARQVGRVMALHGDQVPWWRVLTASGAPAARVAARQLKRLRDEGVPLAGASGERIDLARALHTFALAVAPLGADHDGADRDGEARDGADRDGEHADA